MPAARCHMALNRAAALAAVKLVKAMTKHLSTCAMTQRATGWQLTGGRGSSSKSNSDDRCSTVPS